jgi:hypothetical protein
VNRDVAPLSISLFLKMVQDVRLNRHSNANNN